MGATGNGRQRVTAAATTAAARGSPPPPTALRQPAPPAAGPPVAGASAAVPPAAWSCRPSGSRCSRWKASARSACGRWAAAGRAPSGRGRITGTPPALPASHERGGQGAWWARAWSSCLLPPRGRRGGGGTGTCPCLGPAGGGHACWRELLSRWGGASRVSAGEVLGHRDRALLLRGFSFCRVSAADNKPDSPNPEGVWKTWRSSLVTQFPQR